MTYTYYDETQSLIKAVAEDGSVIVIPVCPGNREYDDLISSGAPIGPYVAPVSTGPTEGEVRLAYQEESDPLFFKWQAGDGTKEEWLAKREEIRSRFINSPTE